MKSASRASGAPRDARVRACAETSAGKYHQIRGAEFLRHWRSHRANRLERTTIRCAYLRGSLRWPKDREARVCERTRPRLRGARILRGASRHSDSRSAFPQIYVYQEDPFPSKLEQTPT